MKILVKIAGGLMAFLALVLVVVRVTGFSPIGDIPGPGNYPGLWLSGEVVTAPVADWSFTKQYKTDKVETRTWYGIPHSVTTSHIVYNGQLYLTSLFRANVPFPDGKAWVNNITRDPRVRVRFGDKLYELVLSHVTDEQERTAVLAARGDVAAAPPPNGAVLHLFRAQQEGSLSAGVGSKAAGSN